MVRSANQSNDVPFKFIHSGQKEIGYIDNRIHMDMDIGSTNDFKMEISYPVWKKQSFNYKEYIFIPGTEFGGIITNIESTTRTKTVNVGGYTWRGLLSKKIVQPPDNENYLILNGELNEVIRSLIGDRFGSLFIVPRNATDVAVTNWKVDRYVSLLDALNKLLANYKCKLKIVGIEESVSGDFHVEISAEHIKDYTNEIEYSGKHYADLNVKDYRGGVNHLICAGEGQGAERLVKHLYVQADGSIGDIQHFTGVDEIEEVYKYNGADEEQLTKDGAKRLKERMSNKQIKATAKEIDVDIGDIIAGYDDVTNTSVTVPVIGKILKMSCGIIKIEHTTKGE